MGYYSIRTGVLIMTLYFYAGGSGGSWDQSINWYEDSDHLIPHNAVPTSTDDVILHDNVTSSMSSGYCNTLITGNYRVDIAHNVATLTVTTQALFQWTGGGDYTGYITCPDVQFYNAANHNGTVVGNASFYNSTYMGVGNRGNASGAVNFYNTSYLYDMSNASTWPTSITFNNNSYNSYSGTIPSGILVIFNDSSYNQYTSTIGGNAIFNGTTQNIGTVSGIATFNGSSQNGDGMGSANVGSGSIFNGSSIHRNISTVNGDAFFNDTSYCYGDVSGTATFSKTAAENMLDNEALPGTIGAVIIKGGGGINGSSILGIL